MSYCILIFSLCDDILQTHPLLVLVLTVLKLINSNHSEPSDEQCQSQMPLMFVLCIMSVSNYCFIALF
jgi:hypothetical protein